MSVARLSIRSTFSVFAAIFAAMTVLGAAPPEHTDTTTLTGQLLIASPNIGDPRFAHTVILMIKHDNAGAFGITINRPVGQRSIVELLEVTGDEAKEISGTVRVFAGGGSAAPRAAARRSAH